MATRTTSGSRSFRLLEAKGATSMKANKQKSPPQNIAYHRGSDGFSLKWCNAGRFLDRFSDLADGLLIVFPRIGTAVTIVRRLRVKIFVIMDGQQSNKNAGHCGRHTFSQVLHSS